MNDLSKNDVLPDGVRPRQLDGWLERTHVVVDMSGGILRADTGLAAWVKSAPEALVGRSFARVLSLIDAAWENDVKAWFKSGFRNGELKLITGDGAGERQFVLEASSFKDITFIRLESVLPDIVRLTENAFDEMSHDREFQEAVFRRLIRAESQLDSLTQRWPGVIFSQKADFSFQFLSPQLVEITGVRKEQWMKNPNLFWEVLHEADEEAVRARIKESVARRESISHTFRVRHSRTGRVTYVMEQRSPAMTSNGIVLGYDGFWIDVTRQTIAERRLSTAAWKETLSVVTMGLAHDFRNLMAGVSALSEQFMHSENEGHPFMESMQLIMNNSRQASQLVNRILSLHHGKPGERNYHDLNELLKEIEELTRKVVSNRIGLEMKLHEGSLPVYLDAVEFRQVAINLLINSADAIAERGTIRIESKLHDDAASSDCQWGTLPTLPAVSFTISDTGCGIKPHHIEKLFDPFFTTKELNKGSGLGLFNARLFVEKHHGGITVRSKEGEGTAFQIWLPLADFTEGERDVAESGQSRRSILFAAPQGRNSDSTVEFLRMAGYHVVVAHSCELAEAMLDSGEYPFAGLFVQTEDLTSDFNKLTACKSKRNVELRTILQIVGRNEDEFSTQFLRRADLILGADVSQASIRRKLEELFAGI